MFRFFHLFPLTITDALPLYLLELSAQLLFYKLLLLIINFEVYVNFSLPLMPFYLYFCFVLFLNFVVMRLFIEAISPNHFFSDVSIHQGHFIQKFLIFMHQLIEAISANHFRCKLTEVVSPNHLFEMYYFNGAILPNHFFSFLSVQVNSPNYWFRMYHLITF